MEARKENLHASRRASWGHGPWEQEVVDEIAWLEPAPDGVGCVLRRNKFCGAWVAMVAVPPSHPMHGTNPDDAFPWLAATYGTRYSGYAGYEIPGVDASGWWWFGFDTHHPLAPFFSGELAHRAARKGGEHKARKDLYEAQRGAYYKNEGQTKALLRQLLDEVRKITPQSVAALPNYAVRNNA